MRWTLLAFALAGCLRDTSFHCDNDTSCGPGGQCEPNGFCSNADSSCASGRRFGDSAGDLANTCVGAPGTMQDAGSSDGSSGTGQCPSGFASISGGNPGHVYQALAGSNAWQGANGECMVETFGHGYLAIPDNGDELGAIASLAGATPFWVGISDQTGSFTNTKNQPQSFLPWAPGQPNDAGNRHCTEGDDGKHVSQERCFTQLPAVCECEN